MHLLTKYIVIALYFIAIFYMWRLLRRGGKVDNPALFVLYVTVSLVLHIGVLYKDIFVDGSLVISFALAFSMAGWISIFLYLCIALRRKNYELGIVVFPIGLAGVLVESVLSTYSHETFLFNPFVSSHIAVAIPTYGVLCLAFAQAIFLLYQDKRLKAGARIQLSASALPSLQSMEINLFRLTLIGFLLLTLNLLLGLQASRDAFGSLLVFDHHIFFSITAWISFAILLIGRKVYGWRGRMAANSVIVAFCILMIAYFGQRFVREFLL